MTIPGGVCHAFRVVFASMDDSDGDVTAVNDSDVSDVLYFGVMTLSDVDVDVDVPVGAIPDFYGAAISSRILKRISLLQHDTSGFTDVGCFPQNISGLRHAFLSYCSTYTLLQETRGFVRTGGTQAALLEFLYITDRLRREVKRSGDVFLDILRVMLEYCCPRVGWWGLKLSADGKGDVVMDVWRRYLWAGRTFPAWSAGCVGAGPSHRCNAIPGTGRGVFGVGYWGEYGLCGSARALPAPPVVGTGDGGSMTAEELVISHGLAFAYRLMQTVHMVRGCDQSCVGLEYSRGIWQELGAFSMFREEVERVRTLSFMLGTHERAGEGVMYRDFDGDVMRLICSFL